MPRSRSKKAPPKKRPPPPAPPAPPASKAGKASSSSPSPPPKRRRGRKKKQEREEEDKKVVIEETKGISEEEEEENIEEEEEEEESSQEDWTEEDELGPLGRKRKLIAARTDEEVAEEVAKRSRRPLSPYQAPVDENQNKDRTERKGKSGPSSPPTSGRKPGILYLSSIPPGFNVSQTTMFFAQFGQVGRVFLQPDPVEKAKSRNGMARHFTEGWVEFASKRVAKEVAEGLNRTQVGGKKRSKSHDTLWNIKYLKGFKWTHLSERLAYEKAVHFHKMRTEISQAKRESDFFKEGVEKSKRLEQKNRKRKRGKKGEAEEEEKEEDGGSKEASSSETRKYYFREKEPDEVIRKRKERKLGETGDESFPSVLPSSSSSSSAEPSVSGKRKQQPGSTKGGGGGGSKKSGGGKRSAAARKGGGGKKEAGEDRVDFFKSVLGTSE